MHPVKSLEPGARSVPYGKPLTNQSFHVLDEFLNPCPVWVPGQLYIGGMGLAQGYWRDQEKTQASFIVHPQTDARLYKTGDWGRYLPNGEIEFLGREDSQVKIRGYRIELGEIEAALLQHPEVWSAALVAPGARGSERRLVAYIVSKAKPAPSPIELRESLRQKLPEYMLPADFVFTEALPLTPNAKVDRGRLAQMSLEQHAAKQTQAAAGNSPELNIQQIVSSVLKRDRVERNQNLLDLGADSLDLVTIASRLEQETGFRPEIAELYYQPTVAALIDNYHRRQM
jgi:acyl-coenzyme A synthetase/AMP-(fatty) acid ligase/acyl carrier protein